MPAILLRSSALVAMMSAPLILLYVLITRFAFAKLVGLDEAPWPSYPQAPGLTPGASDEGSDMASVDAHWLSTAFEWGRTLEDTTERYWKKAATRLDAAEDMRSPSAGRPERYT